MRNENMKRKILNTVTLIVAFYVMFTFIFGMLNRGKRDKNTSGKEYLVKLESKSLSEVQDKIDQYINSEKVIHNGNNNNDSETIKNDEDNNTNLENDNINNAKYYEDTVFMGDSIVEALSEFEIVDSYNVISHKGDTVIKAPESIEKLQNITPKNIVLLYGMNDVIEFDNSSGKDSNTFKEDYIMLINGIKAVLPNSNIYLISPLPVMDSAVNVNYRLTNENLNEFREKVKEVAVETGSTYIDATSIVEGKDYLHEQDGIHFKYDFYISLLDYLRSYIQ